LENGVSMKIIENIIIEFLKRKIRKKAIELYEETKRWRLNAWRDYIEEEFERCKTKWTLKRFPELKNAELNDLTDFKKFPPQDWINPPEDFPAARKTLTSGTFKRKEIQYSKNDLIKAITTAAWYVYSVNKKFHEKGLFLYVQGANNEMYGTSIFAVHAAKILSNHGFTGNLLNLNHDVKRIKKYAPFDTIHCVTPFFHAFVNIIENLEFKLFDEKSILYLTGAPVYSDVFEIIEEYQREHNVKIQVLDYYAATETTILAVQGEEKHRLMYVPFTHYGVIKTDEDVISILDAKPGTIGKYYVTRFFDYMIPNYDIGDLIEVVGRAPNELPLIRVIGRHRIKRIEIKLPKIGEIQGFAGYEFRTPQAGLHGYVFREACARYKARSFVIAVPKQNKVVCFLYMDKPLKLETILKELETHPHGKVMLKMIEYGSIELCIECDPNVVKAYYENELRKHPQSEPFPIILKTSNS